MISGIKIFEDKEHCKSKVYQKAQNLQTDLQKMPKPRRLNIQQSDTNQSDSQRNDPQ